MRLFLHRMERVVLAADFAAKKHRDQRRKNEHKEPYINHPIGVAKILTSEGISLRDLKTLSGFIVIP